VLFLGCTLWTDFALHGDAQRAQHAAQQHMNDYRKIRSSPRYRRLHPQDTLGWHQRSRTWLEHNLAAAAAQGQPAVVLTHHAPSRQSLRPGFEADILSAAYASDLERLMLDYAPAFWLHGHTHWCGSYRVGATQVVSNARGYVDEPAAGFEPDLVLTI
jgi:hypothetical protein